jgi:hypothetical protein
MIASHGKDRELIAQALSDSARSLLADHLPDVSSSDPDSVKPWFIGKLDDSPPVVNLTESGYKLVGGRLDILENRQVAAIVYQHQERFITVFVWPAANRESAEHTFDRGTCSERMAVVRLRPTHQDLFSLSVEDLLNTKRFICIIELGRARMGVDVIDLLRIYLREIQSVAIARVQESPVGKGVVM